MIQIQSLLPKLKKISIIKIKALIEKEQKITTMVDGDMDLADDLVSAGMDQFQILDQPAGKRILDRDDHGIDIVRIIGRQHLPETVESVQFQRDILIESQGGFLVETAPTSQNRYSFHGLAQKRAIRFRTAQHKSYIPMMLRRPVYYQP